MNLKSKEFKALQVKWYKKLKNDGFEDIEQDDDNLKEWALSLQNPRRFNLIKNESKTEYYRLAGHFLHDYTFQSKFEKRVWEMHSNGVSIRDIFTALKAEGFTAYRDNVHGVIKRLKEIMVNRVREK